MNENIGYEHFFIYYYLYLPLSVQCEYDSHKETLEIIHKFEILPEIVQLEKIIEKNAFKDLVKKYSNLIETIVESHNTSKMYILNSKQLNLNAIHSGFSNYNLKNEDIIYGDLKESDNIEVQLGQRSKNKIKYKVTNYAEKHVFSDNLRNELFKFIDLKLMKKTSTDKTYQFALLNYLTKQNNLFKVNYNRVDFDSWYCNLRNSQHRLKLIKLKEFFVNY